MYINNSVRSLQADYDKCYIAFIDMLGFRNCLKANSCSFILGIFDDIFQDYRIVVNLDDTIPFVSKEIVKMKVMSDSICLYINITEPDALAKLVAACAYFQVRLLRRKSPIPTRGAIVEGLIYVNGDILFGPGVTEAYLLEEKTAITPRIILTKHLINKCQKHLSDESRKYLDTYIYDDIDMFCCIDSLLLFYGLYHEKIEWNGFEKFVKEKTEKETDVDIRRKYIYLYENIGRVVDKYMFLKPNEQIVKQ